MARNQKLVKEKEKIATQCQQLEEGTLMKVNEVKSIYSYSSIKIDIKKQKEGAE